MKARLYTLRILLSLGIFSLLVPLFTSCGSDDPKTVVDHYYSALQKGDYDTAVTYLHVDSPNPATNATTGDELRTQDKEWSGGTPIKSYSVGNQSINGQDASVMVTVTRSRPSSGSIRLQQIDGTWKITFADSPSLLY